MPPFLKKVLESEIQSLQQRLETMSLVSVEFLILLSGSTLIATLGLFQNSPAVIIGAMIIAPLMRPLVGLALGTLTGDSRLIGRAVLTLTIGTVVGIVISSILALLFRSLELTPEIVGRTHPTLLDLGVAVFAGAIGAYCQADKKRSETLAGVAIAVALVPPLSVVGIGIAFGSVSVWTGALLLYATNLIGITVAGAVVFLLMGFIPLQQAKKGLLISGVVSILLIVPLALSMRELVLENQISIKIKTILQEKTVTFRGVQLRAVRVERFKEPMIVSATVFSPEQPITSHQVLLVQEFLVKELKVPIQFKLQIIPATQITADGVSNFPDPQAGATSTDSDKAAPVPQKEEPQYSEVNPDSEVKPDSDLEKQTDLSDPAQIDTPAIPDTDQGPASQSIQVVPGSSTVHFRKNGSQPIKP